MLKLYTILPDNDDIGGARQATKVSIMLREIGEEFETIDLDRRNTVRPRDSEYRKLNPNGRVPTIDDDGFVLWEAGVILQYIAETRPAAAHLLPKEPHQRASVLKWLMWDGSTFALDGVTACTLLAAQNREAFVAADMEAMVLAAGGASYLLLGADEEKEQQAWQQSMDMLHWDLQVMELGLNGRDYFGGDEFSIADIALGVVTPVLFLVGVSLKQHPGIRDWVLRLAERESFLATPSFRNHIETAEKEGLL